MKNLSVSKKLLMGFGVILALMILASTLSILSIRQLGEQVDLYSQYTLPHTTQLWTIRRNIVSAQRYITRALLEEEPAAVQSLLESASAEGAQAFEMLEAYAASQRDSSRDSDIRRVKSFLELAASARQKIVALLQNPTPENKRAAYAIFKESYLPPFDEAVTILSEFSTTSDLHAAQQSEEARQAKNLATIMLIAATVVCLVLSVAVAQLLRRSILTPVKRIMGAYEEMSKGNMSAKVEYESRDELGQMAALIEKANSLQRNILQNLMENLARLAKGDLRIRLDMDYPGDFAQLKAAFEETVSNLNSTMQTILIAAEQVSTGASQMASGAEALASGSTEQASSVEELNASVGEIARQAEENSENVKRATSFVAEAVEGVSTGNAHMSELTAAMEGISQASEQITNITKVIEDIAFQTNILALNAAIEAARAGSAGKGFAVVADEVRALAAKSAEAAKQTAELIESSVASIVTGMQTTKKTANILQDVGAKANLVNESILKIEKATLEQARAIEQIKTRLEQISSVVQNNAATAEENSATSEEMSAQAATLRDEVEKFRLR